MRKPQRPGCLRREGGNGGAPHSWQVGKGRRQGGLKSVTASGRQRAAKGRNKPVESLGAAKGNKKGVLQIYQGKRNP